MDAKRLPSNVPESEPREETAAEAFARLDDRVAGLDERIALMVRAVGHMSAERFEVEIPDYNPTLEKTNAWLAEILRRLKAIEDAPALDLTLEDMSARIAAAAQKARETDRASVQQVQQSHAGAVQALHQFIGNARTREQQREYMSWGIGGGFLAGCLLWSILPGAIARSLPQGWHLPEKIAAQIVGAPSLWEGGIRLMRAGCPEAYQAIAAAVEMRRDNRDKIEKCEKAALNSKKKVPCTIKIGHPEI